MDSKENFEQFRNENFLAHNVLTKDNVMEYFYSSQFFDKNSLNQKIRRGAQLNNIFIIQKFSRDTLGFDTPLECYYILAGSIYKCPSLGILLKRRLKNSVAELEKILDSTYQLANWSLVDGYYWGSGNPTYTSELKNSFVNNENEQTVACNDDFSIKKRNLDFGNSYEDKYLNESVIDLYNKKNLPNGDQIIQHTFTYFTQCSLKFNEYIEQLKIQNPNLI